MLDGMSDATDPTREFALGAGTRVRILTRGVETAGRHDLVEATQRPGEMTPLHLHTRYDERLWVIDGQLTVWAGREHYILGPGDFTTIPMHTPHAILAGADGARALNISSPAGFAELVERTAVPAEVAGPDPQLDMDRFMAVTTELGDVVLGPPGTTPDAVDPR
jgi:quercetin dioxygenase-like cupin family protein